MWILRFQIGLRFTDTRNNSVEEVEVFPADERGEVNILADDSDTYDPTENN